MFFTKIIKFRVWKVIFIMYYFRNNKAMVRKTRLVFAIALLLAISYVAVNLKSDGHVKNVIERDFVFPSNPFFDQSELKSNNEKARIELGNTDLAVCQLPKLDPFSPIVMKLVSETKPLVCTEATFTTLNEGQLVVNETLCKERKVSEVYFQTILRYPGDDFKVRLGKKQTLWTSNGRLNTHDNIAEDFVMVVVNITGERPEHEFHLQAFPRPQIFTRTTKKGGLLEPIQKKRMNVMMVMIDSVSHANFQRKANKVLQYMKEKLGTIVLQGHTIVGDGTTPQATAFLTGTAEVDLPEARRGFPNSTFVDKWPFIFYEFKDHGYATLFSEDEYDIATFNLRLYGFRDPPTDHYGRLFWLATAGKTLNHCLKNRSVHGLQFQYIKQFYSAYPDTPKFSLSILSDISHNDVDDLGVAEDEILSFIKEMELRGYLEKTIMLIFGDHGPRFSRYRSTMHGKLEERLPFFSISVPSWFRKKHPELHENLLANSDILTSHFDIYATLKHILLYPEVPPGKTVGQSLLTQLNQSRTCEEIGVEAHWCPCLTWIKLNASTPLAFELAKKVVGYINDLTSTSQKLVTLCERLKLKNVTLLSLLTGSKKVQSYIGSQDVHGRVQGFDENARHSDMQVEKKFEIHFETSPNDGLYEATVEVLSSKRIKIIGEISRVNAYKDQPKCLATSHVNLFKFCFCRS